MRPDSPKSRMRYFARRPTRSTGRPIERLRCRHHRLQRREPERLDALEHLAGEGIAEALGQRLHLRQLGHDSASFA